MLYLDEEGLYQPHCADFFLGLGLILVLKDVVEQLIEITKLLNLSDSLHRYALDLREVQDGIPGCKQFLPFRFLLS